MDKELVEKITKLVLERMSLVENAKNVPLNESEINDWNSFHRGQRKDSKVKNVNSQYLIPLTEKEVEDWKRNSPLNSTNGHIGIYQESNKVKFSKYC